MGPVIFGALSGIFVAGSAIPYSRSVLKGKITISIATWTLWTLIGLAILLNYKQAGAGENIWAAIFGFVNPLIITILTIRGEYRKLSDPQERRQFARTIARTFAHLWGTMDQAGRRCLAFGTSALGLWVVSLYVPFLTPIALIFAMIADVSAVMPTIRHLWKNPTGDFPFAWTLFLIGWLLSFGAVDRPSVFNYVVPAYMSVTAVLIVIPLVRDRIERRAPLPEWIGWN